MSSFIFYFRVVEQHQLSGWQNETHTWYNLCSGEKIEPVSPTQVEIGGLEDGQYHIEWRDTYAGEITKSAMAECVNGLLIMEIPAVAKDVACAIRK